MWSMPPLSGGLINVLSTEYIYTTMHPGHLLEVSSYVHLSSVQLIILAINHVI